MPSAPPGALDRVLIASSKETFSSALTVLLEESGYRVIRVLGADEMKRELSQTPPGILVLETQLQGKSGLELLRQLRAHPSYARLPVIMLGDNCSVDKVSSFELGADDFVVNPPSLRELVLRIRAVLRRSEASPSVETETIQIGPLKIDTERHEVRVNRALVHLTALEFRLLTYLASHSGTACRRERLLVDVWGTDTGAVDRAVDTTIKRLRKKLNSAGNVIETVRSVGYRLRSGAPPFP